MNQLEGDRDTGMRDDRAAAQVGSTQAAEEPLSSFTVSPSPDPAIQVVLDGWSVSIAAELGGDRVVLDALPGLVQAAAKCAEAGSALSIAPMVIDTPRS